MNPEDRYMAMRAVLDQREAPGPPHHVLALMSDYELQARIIEAEAIERAFMPNAQEAVQALMFRQWFSQELHRRQFRREHPMLVSA